MSAIAEQPQPPICLLDASIYIFRYYFSLPDNWFSDDGYATAAVYGYSHFLLNFLRHEKPEKMAACFDESLGSCFRNEIYPEYKSSRALPDEALAFQLNACRQVTELLGVPSYSSSIYEADDLLGSLSAYLQVNDKNSREPSAIAILTRDKDLGQLILREQDFLWDYGSSIKQTRMTRQDIHQKFGVWPEQLVDYLGLVGDAVDDIPGVPGIGAKTAQALLQWGGDIENIFGQIDGIKNLSFRGAKTLGQKLEDNLELLVMSRSLAEIITDVEMQLDEHSVTRKRPEPDAFDDFCQRMGFGDPMRHSFNLLMESL